METATVLCIIEHLSTGGEEMLVTELMPSLGRSGFNPVVVTFMPGNLDQKLIQSGVELIIVHSKSKRQRLVQLIKILRRIKPDIVHTRLFSGGAWGRIAALYTRVPILVHTHGGHTFIEKKWKRLPVEQLLFYFTHRTIAVSHGVKNHLEAFSLIRGGKVQVIYNGLPLPLFTAIPIKAINTPVRLICVGRLETVKGQDIAIRAVKRLPDPIWAELVIAGGGPKFDALQELARRENIAHKVRFLGIRKDIPDLLSSADIFISPSRSEGLPVAVIEAMAAGRPVIATDIPGHKEALGETGLLVTPESPEAMARGLVSMIASKDKSEQMAKMARARAVNMFDFLTMRDAHVSLYQKLVKTKRK